MFNLNDSEFLSVWGVFRKNKMLFILRFGVLMFGLPTCLLGIIFSWILWNNAPDSLRDVLVRTIIFIIVGYIMGLGMYNTNEKRYSALRDHEAKGA